MGSLVVLSEEVEAMMVAESASEGLVEVRIS